MLFIYKFIRILPTLYQSTQFFKQLLTSPSTSSIIQTFFVKSRFKFKKYFHILVHGYIIYMYLILLQGTSMAVTYGHAINLRHTALIT